MFKLAGRHEWEAWTKGKWNIQRACGRRWKKREWERGTRCFLVLREYIGGGAQKRGESQMIDKGASAIAITGVGRIESKEMDAERVGDRGLQPWTYRFSPTIRKNRWTWSYFWTTGYITRFHYILRWIWGSCFNENLVRQRSCLRDFVLLVFGILTFFSPSNNSVNN